MYKEKVSSRYTSINDVGYMALPGLKGSSYFYGDKMDRKRILNTVVLQTGVPESVIFSKSRKSEFVIARQILCYFLFYKGGLTKIEIARMLGKDHTTILYSIKEAEDRMETDPQFQAVYQKVVNYL